MEHWAWTGHGCCPCELTATISTCTSQTCEQPIMEEGGADRAVPSLRLRVRLLIAGRGTDIFFCAAVTGKVPTLLQTHGYPDFYKP